MNRTLLIDADWLCFKAATAVETEIEWAEDQWTLTADVGEAMEMVDRLVGEWITATDGLGVIMTFSCSTGRYFRHDIFPEYKGNRKGKRKPVCYKRLRELMTVTYPTVSERNIEADDLMGIMATNGEWKDSVIVTIDKDLDTVPGTHYNPDKDDLYSITPEQGRWNHMFQTLMGDTTDGFKGCPGVGKVRAEGLLELTAKNIRLGITEPDYTLWDAVTERFDKAGVSQSDANIQAQLAYILQDGDYDFETGEVKLCQWM